MCLCHPPLCARQELSLHVITLTGLTVSGVGTRGTEGGLKVGFTIEDWRPSQKKVNENKHTEYRESYALYELLHHFFKGGSHISKSQVSSCLQLLVIIIPTKQKMALQMKKYRTVSE